MAFFTHEAEHFVWALLEGHGARGGNNKGFALTEDILAPSLLTCFSVFQVYIAYVLVQQLRTSDKPFWRSQNVFALVNIALSFGYLICTCLAVTNLCLKLEFIATLQKAFAWPKQFGGSTSTLPEWCMEFEGTSFTWDDTCWDETSRSIRDLTVFLDNFMKGIFQFMVILADGLLIYRCWLLLSSPWSWVITIGASLLLLISIGVFVVLFVPLTRFPSIASLHTVVILRSYMSVYAPLLLSLIVSPALMTRLWREQREQGKLLGKSGQLVCRRVLRALFESAIPPLALGLFHPILTFYFALGSPCYNIVWISFTVLAPQIIALRVLQARKRLPSQPIGSSRNNQMTTMSFGGPQTALTLSSSSGEDHSTQTWAIVLWEKRQSRRSLYVDRDSHDPSEREGEINESGDSWAGAHTAMETRSKCHAWSEFPRVGFCAEGQAQRTGRESASESCCEDRVLKDHESELQGKLHPADVEAVDTDVVGALTEGSLTRPRPPARWTVKPDQPRAKHTNRNGTRLGTETHPGQAREKKGEAPDL